MRSCMEPKCIHVYGAIYHYTVYTVGRDHTQILNFLSFEHSELDEKVSSHRWFYACAVHVAHMQSMSAHMKLGFVSSRFEGYIYLNLLWQYRQQMRRSFGCCG